MESLKRLLVQPWTRPLVWLLCLLPLLWLWWQAASGAYVNPEEALVRGAGDWALRMLCLTLAVTPLRVTFSLPQLLRFRRVFGLSVSFMPACTCCCMSGCKWASACRSCWRTWRIAPSS